MRHDRLPHPPPDADEFPQLSRGEPRRRAATWSCWSGRTAPARPICIEAISFLAPGRGLRRATLDEVAVNEGDGSWAVSAEVEGALGLATLGTGIEPPAARTPRTSAALPHRPRAGGLGRRLRRSSAHGVADAGDGRAVHWAGLGAAAVSRPAGAGGRRRAFQPRRRAGALAALAQPAAGGSASPTTHWLDAIEHETAELAVAVAAMRGRDRRTAAGRARAPAATRSPFPPPRSRSTAGWKTRCSTEPATEIEDRYRAVLRDNRARDAAAGRTLDGPHLTDLQVIYAPKNMPARDASTGEQKALLIGLVLAHAGLVAEMTGIAPLLLLDEVVAHLDPGRRAALFDELGNARRAGLDDRRRSGGLRRDRRPRARFSTSSPGRDRPGAADSRSGRRRPDRAISRAFGPRRPKSAIFRAANSGASRLRPLKNRQ